MKLLECAGYGCDEWIETPGQEYVSTGSLFYHAECWEKWMKSVKAHIPEDFQTRFEKDCIDE